MAARHVHRRQRILPLLLHGDGAGGGGRADAILDSRPLLERRRLRRGAPRAVRRIDAVHLLSA